MGLRAIQLLSPRPRRRWIVVGLVAASLLSGCADTAPPEAGSVLAEARKELRAFGAEESADSLEDGEVSTDDYYAAARRYRSCMAEIGIDIRGPQLSPVDNITLEWRYPALMPEGPGVTDSVESCTAQWSPMIEAYEATHTAQMNSDLLRAVRDCLAEQGFSTEPEAANIRALVGPLAGDDHARLGATEQCIGTQMDVLYPEAYGVTVIY